MHEAEKDRKKAIQASAATPFNFDWDEEEVGSRKQRKEGEAEEEW